MGQNLTGVANITSQFDVYVERSSLLGLTRYVCLPFFSFLFFIYYSIQFTISSARTARAANLGKLASSLKTPLPSADPTK